MGVLLSKPNTDKEYDDGENAKLTFAACNMQVCRFPVRSTRLPTVPRARVHLPCSRRRRGCSPAAALWWARERISTERAHMGPLRTPCRPARLAPHALFRISDIDRTGVYCLLYLRLRR